MCVRVSKLCIGCCGRSCMASREAARKAARERQARLAAAWPTVNRSARAHPAAARANGAAAAAGSPAPSTSDSHSDPDDDAGNDPHAGGACSLFLAVLLVSECC
jgi:hypothetical protein